MTLGKAFLTVSGLTAVSRVLGFFRDVLFAAVLGTGIAADAFLVAFKLPNFFRRLLAEGAFNAVFIPIFARRLENEGEASARRFADEALAVLAVVLAVLVAVFEVAMPWIMTVLAPGFVDEPEKFALAVDLTRITFPYLLLITLVALFGGMLNSVGRFAAYAAAPILLNLSLIAAALAAHLLDGAEAGRALSWGVALGGLLQLALVLQAVRRAGLVPRWLAPRLTPGVKELLRRFVPAALGAGVVQVNLLIDLWVASFLPTGAISWLYYADRVNQLPLGVIGIAVGTALLPLLSRQIAAGDRRGADESQSRAVELALVFCLPAAAALVAIPLPIMAALFERGAFDAADSAAAAAALMAFAAGLPAYVLIKVLAPAFFARRDPSTVLKIAVAGLLSNLAVMASLVWFLGHVGIALATAVAAWINALLLYVMLVRRGHFTADDRLRRRLPRIVAATAAMAAVLLAAHGSSAAWWPAGQDRKIAYLAVLVILGSSTYAVLARLFGAIAWSDVRDMIRRDSG